MFKDTNGVIRSRKFKMDREYNHQLKNDNQTVICKPLHRTLKIGQYEPHGKLGWTHVLQESK